MICKFLIRRVLMPACLIFTLLTLGFTGLITLLEGSAYIEPLGLPGPTFKALIGFLVYSLLISSVNQIFGIKSLSFGFKVLLHYIGFIGSFLLIFLLVLSDSSKTVGALIIAAVLTVFYLIGVVIAVVVRHTKRKAENESEDYKQMFS